MTIELSTTMPSDKMSTQSVMQFSSSPQAMNSPSEMKMVMGMVPAATSAVRSGNSSITTTMTAMTAMASSLRNFFTASSTTFDWSVMLYSVMSLGSVSSNSAIWRFTASPIATMSWPFFISTDSSRHLWPLFVMYDSGAGYSRLMSATSFSRTTSPVGVESTIISSMSGTLVSERFT